MHDNMIFIAIIQKMGLDWDCADQNKGYPRFDKKLIYHRINFCIFSEQNFRFN